MAVYSQFEFVVVDKQPDDSVVHLYRCGKADRLAEQALDPGPQRKVLAFNLLRIPLARLVRIMRSESNLYSTAS